MENPTQNNETKETFDQEDLIKKLQEKTFYPLIFLGESGDEIKGVVYGSQHSISVMLTHFLCSNPGYIKAFEVALMIAKHTSDPLKQMLEDFKSKISQELENEDHS
jgi:hypothetical protein